MEGNSKYCNKKGFEIIILQLIVGKHWNKERSKIVILQLIVGKYLDKQRFEIVILQLVIGYNSHINYYNWSLKHGVDYNNTLHAVEVGGQNTLLDFDTGLVGARLGCRIAMRTDGLPCLIIRGVY